MDALRERPELKARLSSAVIHTTMITVTTIIMTTAMSMITTITITHRTLTATRTITARARPTRTHRA